MANNPGFTKCDYPDNQQPSCPTQNPPSYFSSQSNGNNFPPQQQYPMVPPTNNGYYPAPAPAPVSTGWFLLFLLIDFHIANMLLFLYLPVVNVSTQSAAPNIIVVGGGGGCKFIFSFPTGYVSRYTVSSLLLKYLLFLTTLQMITLAILQNFLLH
jgi:hypothetical protein